MSRPDRTTDRTATSTCPGLRPAAGRAPARAGLALMATLSLVAALAVVGPGPAGASVGASRQGPASPAPAGSGNLGTVVVVHGLAGITADVYLDGSDQSALSGFEFKRVTDALVLPAGEHRADLRRSGDPATSPPLLSGSFTVTAGQLITVAALLGADGTPRWLAFPDDGRRYVDGPAELRFRHFAATGPVNLVIDGTTAQTDVTNLGQSPQTAPIAVTAGTHTVAVQGPDGATVAFEQIQVDPGAIVVMHLTGRSDDGSLTLLRATWSNPDPTKLAEAAKVPAGIPSGNSGLAAPPGPRGVSDRSATPIDASAGRFAGVRAEGQVPDGLMPGVGRPALSTTPAAGAAERPDQAAAEQANATYPAAAVVDPALALGGVAWTGTLPPGALNAGDHRSAPVAIRIAGLGVTATVVAVGLDNQGDLALPADPGVIAWYQSGPSPGDSGSAVLAGHVDYNGAKGALFDLGTLAAGSDIEVMFADGSVRSFRTASAPVARPKVALPIDQLFRRGGSPTLTLVTCGGTFNPTTRSYADNVLVSAGLTIAS